MLHALFSFISIRGVYFHLFSLLYIFYLWFGYVWSTMMCLAGPVLNDFRKTVRVSSIRLLVFFHPNIEFCHYNNGIINPNTLQCIQHGIHSIEWHFFGIPFHVISFIYKFHLHKERQFLAQLKYTFRIKEAWTVFEATKLHPYLSVLDCDDLWMESFW